MRDYDEERRKRIYIESKREFMRRMAGHFSEPQSLYPPRRKPLLWRRMPDGSRARLLRMEKDTDVAMVLVARRGRQYLYVEVEEQAHPARARARGGRWDAGRGGSFMAAFFGDGFHRETVEMPAPIGSLVREIGAAQVRTILETLEAS